MRPQDKKPKTISELLIAHEGRALDTVQVQAMFGYSKMGLHKLTKQGQIPHFRCGGRIKFDPIALLRCHEAQMIG